MQLDLYPPDIKIFNTHSYQCIAPVEKPGTLFEMHGELEYLMADVDYALKELGVDYVDIITLCRVPTNVSIEVSFVVTYVCVN